MTKIAALSVQTPNRPSTAQAAAPVVAAAKGLDKAAATPAAAPAQAATLPVSTQNISAQNISAQNTKAPAQPAVSSTLMGALIDVQSKVEAISPQVASNAQQVLQSVVQTITDHSTRPAPAQTNGTPTSQGHGAGPSSDHRGPVTARGDHGDSSGHDGHVDHGQDGDHHDRGWHGKPPVPTPPPLPTPTPEPPPVVIPSFDPSVPARAIAEASKTLAEGRAADAARTAFVTASVERRAEAFVAQGQAALALFKGMQAQYSAWQDQQAPSSASYLKALYA